MLREFVNKPGGFWGKVMSCVASGPIARAKGGSVSREELEGIKATEDDGGFEFDFKKGIEISLITLHMCDFYTPPLEHRWAIANNQVSVSVGNPKKSTKSVQQPTGSSPPVLVLALLWFLWSACAFWTAKESDLFCETSYCQNLLFQTCELVGLVKSCSDEWWLQAENP